MISVIIPTFEHGKTIGLCLSSLLKQSRLPHEIIVIDDGSTDETRQIVESFKDQVLYYFQSNQGAPSARNAGAAIATGTFLLFCDADIVACPDMLERLSDALHNHPEASYAYSGFFWGYKRFASQPFNPDLLLRTSYIHTTSLIRRDSFPGFDPSLKRFQDWDLYLTMLQLGYYGVAVDLELFKVIETHGRKGISRWLPSFTYRIPWKRIGWKPRIIEEYENAQLIVKIKHHLLDAPHT